MVSAIECTPAEREHLSHLWSSLERRRERVWTLSRPRSEWARRSRVHGVQPALILERHDGELWVAWIASAAVTKTRNDDINCKIEASDAYALAAKVPWSRLLDGLSTGARAYASAGGTLPKGAGEDVLAELRRLDPNAAQAIARILALQRQYFIDTPEQERKAFQRDGIITALKMAGFAPADHVMTVIDPAAPSEAPWAVPRARIIEDEQVVHDARVFNEWAAKPGTVVTGTLFVDPASGQRLSIYCANRTAVEGATGADLIYYHETLRCFILVQYKKLSVSRGIDKWRYYPSNDTSLETELAKLLDIDESCALLSQPGDDYRLAGQPTWFKFCQEQNVVPRETELVPGMYLPRPYFASLLEDEGSLIGELGGKVVNYRTVPRYMDNTTFTSLVAGGWIGTSALGTEEVNAKIRESLARGDDLVYAHAAGKPLMRAEQVAAQRNRSTTADRNAKRSALDMDALFNV